MMLYGIMNSLVSFLEMNQQFEFESATQLKRSQLRVVPPLQ
ncbi:unnamed protein product [Paramecium primaurelia]|uniref:Uncharacterized protein n=1 Tax=Paramecium primaurelia TaxID=5886 RepID=A0A8S1LL43_PARPR|nr:unnamed protein product [Paramecium primaurelia]